MNTKSEVRKLTLQRLINKSNQVIDDISKLKIQIQMRHANQFLHFKESHSFPTHHSAPEVKD